MSFRKAAGIAFAACAAIAIGLFIYCTYGGNGEGETGEIRTFSSYSQIEKVLSEIEEEEPYAHMLGGTGPVENEMSDAGDVLSDGAMAPDSAAGIAASKESEHSDTYIQVEGVDEADIIKTDGDYIYYTSRLGFDVVIAKITDGKAREAALIPEEQSGVCAEDIFLTGGRLIITGTEYSRPESSQSHYGMEPQVTAVCIYDVSDPEKPKPVGKYRQSGIYASSRVTDGYLYLVTNDYLDWDQSRIVPSAGQDKDYGKLAADHISCFPKPNQKAYAVIGAVDVNSPEGDLKTDTRAVLGSSEQIYCSGSAVYLTDYCYDFRNAAGESADERTTIIKAEISKGSIAFAKQGSIRGSVLNQFAMDEKDGYFRVAATAFVKGKDVNYLYILDKDLKVVGKVRGFAAGEQVKAVRFLGDTAYVITYEQTDPLFVIDLKDPKSPEILGNVKITGFSSLLIPEGEDMIIGIGSSTSEEEFGEVEDGLKIALFDIHDPAKPEVLDSKVYKDCYSAVQTDHRALTVNSEEGWYAIPYASWEKETGGVLQFHVSDGRLKEDNNYKSDSEIERCLFAGEYIYGLLSNDDKIVSWKAESGAKK